MAWLDIQSAFIFKSKDMKFMVLTSKKANSSRVLQESI